MNIYKDLRQPMDQPLAMYVTIELLRIAEQLQRVGVIHGDVKPDNILIRDE